MAWAEPQSAFTAGEFSPALYGRTDIDKYERGAALLRNFFVDYRGGATNRPGTKFYDDLTSLVTDAALPPRLLPFVVSTDAGYVLVLTDSLITVYLRGVSVDTVATPYAAVDLFQIKYAQSADVMTLTHPAYPPANLTRLSAFSFSYDVIAVGPKIGPPVIVGMRAPHSGPYSYGYLATAVDLDGKEESLPSNIGVKHSEVLNETTNRVIGLDGTQSAGPTSRYNFYKWGPIDSVTMVPATQWGFIGSSAVMTFSDNNIAPDFTKQPPQWGDPFSGGQIQSITVTAGGSGYDGVSGDWTAIPYVPLSISGDGTDAAGYAVIDHANGIIIAAYITNPGKNYTTATITANGEGGTGATFTVTFSDLAPIFPACVSYIQQRRTFGGSDAKPETLVLSQTGLYDNFDSTPAALATDAITVSIASLQVNTIKSFVPAAYGLVIFTTGGCFLLNGGSPYAALTPETVTVQAQSAVGANDLPPLTINYDILYGQNKGNRIHNLAFAWQRQSYTGSDISTLAAHLFDDHMTVDWCYAEEPFKIVWAVRDDGRLLSCTYVPDQEVFAWARHDTQGLFKSITSVPESRTNAVYVVAERFVPSGDTALVELTRTGRPTTQCVGGYASGTPSILIITNIVGPITFGDTLYAAMFPDGATVDSQTNGIPGEAGTYSITPLGPVFNGSTIMSFMLGTVAGSVLTVTAAGTNDALEVGAFVIGDGITDGTYITSLGTGTGGLGTYNLNQSMTVAAPVILTSQYGWRVPASFNATTNSVTLIGSGGDGGAGKVGNAKGGGGGGAAAWATKATVPLTPGTYVPYQVGRHGMKDNDDWGGGSWFNGVSVNADMVWPDRVSARGGGDGDDTGFGRGGAGGNGGVGDTVNFGMQGGDGEDFGVGVTPAAGGGGGGAPWTGVSQIGANGSSGIGGDGGDANGGATPGGGPSTNGTNGTEAHTFGAGSGGGGGSASGDLFGGNGGSWGAGGGGVGFDGVNLGTPGVGRNGYIAIEWELTPEFQICGGWQFYLERFDDRLSDCLEQAWFVDSGVRMALNDGDGEFKIDAVTGDGVLTYCPDEVGHTFAVDDVVVIGCTRVRVTADNGDDTYNVTIIGTLAQYVIPGDPDDRLQLFTADMWSWVTPTDIVSGLDHLEGKEVWTLADGVVDGPRTVTSGAIELAAPAAIKTTGLLFQQQIKTLYLTVQGLQAGSDQSKRKQVPAVSLRLDNTLGLQVGLSFDDLTAVADTTPPVVDPSVTPVTTFSGDAYQPVMSNWTETGEVCIQSDLPLPAQVLGVITYVVAGDTGR